MIGFRPVVYGFAVVVAVCGADRAITPRAWAAPVQDRAATTTAAEGSPEGTLAKALAAANAGNGDALVACFDKLTPAQEAALRRMAVGMGIGEQLRAAAAGRFGPKPALDLVKGIGFRPVDPAVVKQAKGSYAGDAAVLRVGPLGTMKFVKVGGAWKLASGMMDNAAGAPFFAHLASAVPEFRQVVEDVQAGKFATLHDLRVTLNRKVARVQNAGTEPVDVPARPTVLGPGKTPKETIAALHWVNVDGDYEAGAKCFHTPSAEQRVAVRNAIEFANAGTRLRAAIEENFGRTYATNAYLTLGLDAGVTGTLLEGAAVEEKGDRARVDLTPSGIDHLDLVRSDGLWRVDLGTLVPRDPKLVEKHREYYLPALVKLTEEIRAGKYESAAQLDPRVAQLHGELMADYRAAEARAGGGKEGR